MKKYVKDFETFINESEGKQLKMDFGHDFETKKISYNDIHQICKNLDITNYNINDDGSLDVLGSVNISNYNLKELPLKFNKVGGHFACNGNRLTTLKGCPKEVGGDFYCSNNDLTTLEYCPKKVGGLFDILNNDNLLSLDFIPKGIEERELHLPQQFTYGDYLKSK